jgi:protein TonB
MLANANPLEAAPASRSVREFIAVCARHNIPYGDLNCLSALLRELNVNKHFAMHFWSVVAGMVDKQSVEPEAVLTAIVEAVTRRTPADVREAGPAHRSLVERLERILAGQDVAHEDVAESELKSAGVADGIAPVAERPVDPVSADEAVLPIRRVAMGKRGRGRKRGAIEPEPIPPVTNPAWTRDESLRLVLTPEPQDAESVKRQVSDPLVSRGSASQPRRAVQRPVPVPLSSYAEEAPRRSAAAGPLVTVIGLAILAGGGYLLWRGGGTQMLDRLGISARAGYDSAVANWRGEPAQTAPSTPASSTAAGASTSAASANQPTAPPATRPTVPAPAPSTVAAPASQTPPPVQVSAHTARPVGSGLTPEQSMAATAAYNQQRELAATPAPTATTGAGGLVQVPEGVMNAHLIASRVPVLPDDAHAKGLTGVVRIQATINRSGYVSRLHVLQGPTELRAAALTAVSAWRYRPYLVDGQPVDVVTTITVDFSSFE